MLLQKGGQYISWKSIESLYLTESATSTPGVRLCHKLTKDHVWLTSYTRMRVNLAAQVRILFLIAVMSFTELGPQLLKLPNVDYLLSEVFSQDPLERYFSRQRHRGESNDNPTAEQVPLSGMTLIQQQAIYRDLKTMNVDQEVSNLSASQPLKKRPRITRQ